jgi:hypothetical protein
MCMYIKSGWWLWCPTNRHWCGPYPRDNLIIPPRGPCNDLEMECERNSSQEEHLLLAYGVVVVHVADKRIGPAAQAHTQLTAPSTATPLAGWLLGSHDEPPLPVN